MYALLVGTRVTCITSRAAGIISLPDNHHRMTANLTCSVITATLAIISMILYLTMAEGTGSTEGST